MYILVYYINLVEIIIRHKKLLLTVKNHLDLARHVKIRENY